MMNPGISRSEGVGGESGKAWALHLISLTVVLIALCILYWDAFQSLFYMWWTEGTYSHGLLVFPISLYLIWEQRRAIGRLQPSFNGYGAVLIVMISLLWLIGDVIYARMIEHFALVTFLLVLSWMFVGRQVTRAVLFPLLFLYLSIPIWDPVVTPFLQDFTSKVVFVLLNLIGVPVLLDGHFLTIPEGVFEVARTCAGTRYFIAGLTLSLLYAYLMYTSFKRQVLFVLVAIVFCLVVNCARVLIVVMAGHLTDMQHPYVHDHVTMGWVLFVSFIVPLFWFGMRYQEHETQELNSIFSNKVVVNQSMVKVGLIASLAMVALASGPVLSNSLKTSAQEALSNLSEEVLPQADGWAGPLAYQGQWRPGFVDPDQEVMNTYLYRDTQLHYYVARYAVQAQDKELTDNDIYDREVWYQRPGGETRTIDIGEIWPHKVSETVIQSAAYGDKVVWQWYSVAGLETANTKYAKLLELAKLFEEENTSSATVLAVDGHDIEKAHAVMKRFLSDMGKDMKSGLNHSEY